MKQVGRLALVGSYLGLPIAGGLSAFRGQDEHLAADGEPPKSSIAGIFVINLDDRTTIYRDFLDHTSHALGVPHLAIARSPGVLAEDQTLAQPWVRQFLPGIPQVVRQSRGALGVSLAHLALWRDLNTAPACARDPNAYALVFEDDERIRDSFALAVKRIEAFAIRATPSPDLILLNALRPTGEVVGSIGPAKLLKAGPHAESGRRPNVWTSAYLVRCGSALSLIEKLRGMKYHGTLWNGLDPQFDVVLQDMFARRESNLTEWVVSPSQAISFHSEVVSMKRAIDKMGTKNLRAPTSVRAAA
mmetsp:Transcript_31868/g.91818  ORF Transcript_31868/g.91818 Transcript_31868/m.91818 type:complete len:302 (-) Transcript_31868:93-998(-)